jgi:L-threonylcarbamoyladenylate synthase
VALPTDTFFALACDPLNPAAMAMLCHIKQPLRGRPWPRLVSTGIELTQLGCTVTDMGEELIRHFWPGQVTIVLPCTGPLSLAAGRADDGAVGLRAPSGPKVLLEILDEWRGAVTGTSANKSGEPPAASEAEVADYFGETVDFIVPGRCPGGVVSTVVDATGSVPVIIREGAVPTTVIMDSLS